MGSGWFDKALSLSHYKTMKSVPSLQTLLFELQKLPGIGPRSAQRLAQHILKAGEKDILLLCKSLNNLKTKIKKCVKCFNFTENHSVCPICEDPYRDSQLLCVVKQPFDVLKVENCGAYKGFYHVLHGAISPLHGIHPEDLTLSALAARLKKENIKELILAIDSDLEGDTTALYISQMVEKESLTLSRLAQGIPSGGVLDFVDDRTLSQAIENRSAF